MGFIISGVVRLSLVCVSIVVKTSNPFNNIAVNASIFRFSTADQGNCMKKMCFLLATALNTPLLC